MITIDPQVVLAGLVAALTALVTAVGFYIRERALTKSYVDKQQSDIDRAKEETAAGQTNALIDIAKQGVVAQMSMIEAVNKIRDAFAEMTRSNMANAAEMRGMTAMIETNTKATRSAAIGVDELSEKVATDLQGIKDDIKDAANTLKTDIGASITEQFVPLVLELKNIGFNLTTLVTAVQSKDGDINVRLTELIDSFQKAEKKLMRALEPIIIKHIGDLVHDPQPSDNHNTD